MGIHVTLTGMRGFIAPILAVGMYEIIERYAPGHGGWVFAVCLALNLIGVMPMHKRMVARTKKMDFGDTGPPVQPPAAG
jgi:hypothetical protein